MKQWQVNFLKLTSCPREKQSRVIDATTVRIAFGRNEVEDISSSGLSYRSITQDMISYVTISKLNYCPAIQMLLFNQSNIKFTITLRSL